MNYGQKIAELRKGKNLTQSALGSKLNVTAQAVSKWENGLSEPDIESMRKMCQIFEVSVDEFLGLPSPIQAKEELAPAPAPAPVTTRIINGYCEACKEPVGPGEYSLDNFVYDPDSRPRTVIDSPSQHVYCNDCYQTLLEIKKSEDKVVANNEKRQKEIEEKLAKKKAEEEKAIKVAGAKGKVTLGLIVAAIICAVVSAIVFGVHFGIESRRNDSVDLVLTIILAVGSFTFSAQCFWNGFIKDVMGWFCRSFRWPFGFIFTLSLDGILWLITVKLALWIIGAILSVIFFIIGLIFSLTLSFFTFPFVLVQNLKKAKEGIAFDD